MLGNIDIKRFLPSLNIEWLGFIRDYNGLNLSFIAVTFSLTNNQRIRLIAPVFLWNRKQDIIQQLTALPRYILRLNRAIFTIKDEGFLFQNISKYLKYFSTKRNVLKDLKRISGLCSAWYSLLYLFSCEDILNMKRPRQPWHNRWAGGREQKMPLTLYTGPTQ